MCSEVWNTEGCIWENLVVWAIEKKPSGLLKHGTQESQWRRLELQDNKGKTRAKCLLATKVSLFCLLTSVPQRRFSSEVEQRRVSADAWEEHTVVFVKSKRTTRSKRRARYSLDEPLELRCLGWILSHDMNGGAGLASPQWPQTHTHTHNKDVLNTHHNQIAYFFISSSVCHTTTCTNGERTKSLFITEERWGSRHVWKSRRSRQWSDEWRNTGQTNRENLIEYIWSISVVLKLRCMYHQWYVSAL